MFGLNIEWSIKIKKKKNRKLKIVYVLNLWISMLFDSLSWRFLVEKKKKFFFHHFYGIAFKFCTYTPHIIIYWINFVLLTLKMELKPGFSNTTHLYDILNICIHKFLSLSLTLFRFYFFISILCICKMQEFFFLIICP